jgi:hypothetical protein
VSARTVKHWPSLSEDQDCPICGERKSWVYIKPAESQHGYVTLVLCWSCDSLALDVMELPDVLRAPRRERESLSAFERGTAATMSVASWIIQQEAARVAEEQRP